jgi:putative Holliday junction resolvase
LPEPVCRMIQQPRTGRKPSKWRDRQGLRYTRPPATVAGFTTKESRDGRTLQGRVLAIDIGAKRVGVAVSDELRLSVRPLPTLQRTSWKRLLGSLAQLCETFDVRMIVLGLPLRLDGTEGDAALEVRRVARNLELSLKLPLFLQDERLTSKTAEASLRQQGFQGVKISERIDSEAASIILSDYLAGQNALRTHGD